MTLPLDLPGLEKATASSVKTRGWPSLMRTVREKQALVITNHNHPEAVIVDIKAYQELLAKAAGTDSGTRAADLERLRARFDTQLASLDRDGGLGKVLGQPIRRGRKVTLGQPL
ncbi:type II toxin-antitoxin system prevent-host-death family antitoxin [Stenotrophomonas rhizophila]|uniref:type II toxin-antitoxin system prevent-host-death family antitoxin n=1 Tax=Stenotrophomonas rhizophila TaxID=216778 RepID=UPI001E3D2173|nr:type II toxin-antitoxin system prevent-host-death family antitoxin [Stenotrophomonas rhizophila]MCC7633966.1 type II toxin-antitoxin system prevent-host-death family antitoxin [Stenotrophomonas rhizophila]MCC7663300.1 type II toxin-antitoxin system prevent-host-death family antitoxin [Stenotrophomonas rhizophila]